MISKRLWLVVVLSACLALGLVNGSGAIPAQAAASIPRGWAHVIFPGFGLPTNVSISSLAVYNNQLYAGTINWTYGGGIWRTSDGIKWEVVAAPGTISTVNNPAIISMFVFNGKLYAGTAWSSQPTASYIVWRYDGANWQQVLNLGLPVNGFSTFEVFNNELYVGAFKTVESHLGADIYKSPTGDAGSWVPVMTNGNGNANSFSITSLKAFGGFLYAAMGNEVDGVQVLRSNNGTTWTAVVNNGFTGGCGTTVKVLCNWDAGGFSVFNNNLYLGARNEIPEQWSIPSSQGGVLYRTADGTTWTPVTTNGFGNVQNTKIEGTVTYNNVLYALTFNATAWENPATGLQIWSSADGVNFIPVRADGLGGKYNTNSLWTNAQAVFNGRLYIGTSNKDPNHGGELYMNVDNQIFLPLAKR